MNFEVVSMEQEAKKIEISQLIKQKKKKKCEMNT